MQKMNRIKILSFGSLLKEYGGNLTTGLALVMWKLAYHINKKDGFKVSFAVTDYHCEKSVIEGLDVVGWSKIGLFKHIFRHIHVATRYFIVSIYLLIFYRQKLIRTFIYLIFFDKTIRESNPDILHVHGTNYVYFHFLNRRIKKPMILTIHGMNGFDPNIKSYIFQRKIEQLITQNKFNKIIFVSSELKSQWVEMYGNPISESTVVLNAYDQKYFNFDLNEGKLSEKIIITSVGGVIPRKGQEKVIKSLSDTVFKNNFEYWIIGDGDMKYIANLKTIAISLGVEVKFFGPLQPPQVAKKLKQSNYMILPSSSEGFGIAYLESIACGTKVIIPISLPLSKEKNILNTINSIFIKDSSVEAIVECLTNLPSLPEYNRYEVSQSVTHLNWENISDEYYRLIKSQ